MAWFMLSEVQAVDQDGLPLAGTEVEELEVSKSVASSAPDDAQRGVDFMGLPGGYTWVNTRAEQLITHGVEPKENALTCAACHSTRTQMDLRTLGYVLKGPQSQVCAQCHEQKNNSGFSSVHKKHVESEGIDCSMCHTFTRPERGLSIGIKR